MYCNQEGKSIKWAYIIEKLDPRSKQESENLSQRVEVPDMHLVQRCVDEEGGPVGKGLVLQGWQKWRCDGAG
jgi:hypothetical protein